MEIFGVGAPELFFILILAILILGPKDMEKAGRTIGRWLNSLIHSDSWYLMQKTTQELRNLPVKLMRDANNEIARTEEDIRRELNAQYFRSHTSPASRGTPDLNPPKEEAHSIQAPTVKKAKSAPRKKTSKAAGAKKSASSGKKKSSK